MRRPHNGVVIASEPREPVEVPRAVVGLAGGRGVRAVWRNELGGLTFQVGAGDARWFVKWAPAGSGLDLPAEAARLRWAGRYAAVPRVLDAGADEDGAWLVTAGLPGRSAVDERWKRDPATAVRAIGAGLRALHDTLPVADCPFDWSAERRLAAVPARDRLGPPPPVDGPVVCHGDACAPNTLVGDDGRWTGHVDLGALGVADRWADLAVATWSTEWNYGPGWERPLLDAYGIAPDPRRTAYYRRLWELGD